VALEVVGDADEALLGRGQQQPAAEGIDGAVGHVQDLGLVGRGEAGVQPALRLVVDLRERGEQVVVGGAACGHDAAAPFR
jgi:hypothetical protein